ncbi:MAG TPA: hypothetical protein VGK44_09670 [Casimicrobiaceae bacterium]|jgi:hypothetical protein
MKIVAAVLLWSALYTVDASAVEKWGPTWSEVTGTRYSRITMNRSPAIIKSIDGRNYTTRVIKIEPGRRTVVVQAPPRQGLTGFDKHMPLDIAPCKRYYINAQFDSSVGPQWKPVVAYVERIAGCKITKPAPAPAPA